MKLYKMTKRQCVNSLGLTDTEVEYKSSDVQIVMDLTTEANLKLNFMQSDNSMLARRYQCIK